MTARSRTGTDESTLSLLRSSYPINESEWNKPNKPTTRSPSTALDTKVRSLEAENRKLRDDLDAAAQEIAELRQRALHDQHVIRQLIRQRDGGEVNNKGVKAQDTDTQHMRIAMLLFDKWPHPINLKDLSRDYQLRFGVPLLLTEEAIINNEWISKHRNSHALLFRNEPNYDDSQDEYVWRLDKPGEFLKTLDTSQMYDLIRKKVDRHMRAVHPEGVLESELSKMFKRWIGVDVEALVNINIDEMFDRHCDGNAAPTSQELYLVVKGQPKPHFPVKQTWRSNSLNLKHMLICALNEGKQRTLDLSVFGVEVDMASHFTQKTLLRLIDMDVLDNEGAFVLSENARGKYDKWLKWWNRQKNRKEAANEPTSWNNLNQATLSEDAEVPASELTHKSRRSNPMSSHSVGRGSADRDSWRPPPIVTNGNYENYDNNEMCPVTDQSPNQDWRSQDQDWTAYDRNSNHAQIRNPKNRGQIRGPRMQQQQYNGSNGSNGSKKFRWTCTLCGVNANSVLQKQDHLKGNRHRANLQEQRGRERAGPYRALLFIGGFPDGMRDPLPVLHAIEEQYHVRFDCAEDLEIQTGCGWDGGFIRPASISADSKQTVDYLVRRQINFMNLIQGIPRVHLSVRIYRESRTASHQ